MGQQIRTQPAVHTGVPGIQTAPSPFGATRTGSMAVPTPAGVGVPPPPTVKQPQFVPPAAPSAAVPGGRPEYALALRNRAF